MAKSRRSRVPVGKQPASARGRAPRLRRAAVSRPGAKAADPKGRPTATPPAGGALELYESGLRALQGHDYPSALEAFTRVLNGFPEERDVAERAGLYIKVCRRHLNDGQGPAAIGARERLADATFLLNIGQFGAAIERARAVLQADEENDHAHYVLALAHTLEGNAAAAVRHLSRAIDLNKDCLSNVLVESDFDSLRSNPAFRALVETAPDGPRRRTRSK